MKAKAKVKAKKLNLPEFLVKLDNCLEYLEAFDTKELKQLRVALRKLTSRTPPEEQDSQYHLKKALLRVVSLKITQPWTKFVEKTDEEIPF